MPSPILLLLSIVVALVAAGAGLFVHFRAQPSKSITELADLKKSSGTNTAHTAKTTTTATTTIAETTKKSKNPWKRLSPEGGPSPRLVHAAAEAGNRYVYIFGGLTGMADDVHSDMFRFDTVTEKWERIEPSSSFSGSASTWPSARLHHSLTAVGESGSKLLLFGGFSTFGSHPKHRAFGDLWQFDTATSTWELLDDGSAVPEHPKPSPRGAHQAMWLNSALYIFFGFEKISPIGHGHELWKYDLAARKWANLTATIDDHSQAAAGAGAASSHDDLWPDARIGFSMGRIDDHRAFLFGGGATILKPLEVAHSILNNEGVHGHLNDSWIFDARASRTADLFTRFNDAQGGGPLHRKALAGAAIAPGHVAVFGGAYVSMPQIILFDTLWVLDVNNKIWTLVTGNNQGQASNDPEMPPIVFGHSFTVVNGNAYVFGGRAREPMSPGSNELWKLDIPTALELVKEKLQQS